MNSAIIFSNRAKNGASIAQRIPDADGISLVVIINSNQALSSEEWSSVRCEFDSQSRLQFAHKLSCAIYMPLRLFLFSQ